MKEGIETITILPLVAAFIFTTLTAPFTILFSKKIGLLDDPKKRKHPAIIHKKPVPRGGGISLFLGIAISSYLFLPITNLTISLFLASFTALLIGVLDDKFDISPYLRFIVNIITSLIVVYFVSIPFITNPFGGILNLDKIQIPFSIFGRTPHLGDAVAIVWIVWVMNMLNWSKGVDGQMPGIVAVSSAVIGILSMRFGLLDQNSIIATTLSFIIAGASLGFLLFNFYPAKMFPGYGATSMYLLLASVSILSGAKLATAILVMGVPMIDGVFTIVRRILEGHSPFWHDKKHLHHLLLRFGFGQRRIALFYWVLSAILGAISLTLSSTGKLFAIVMLVVLVGGILTTLHLITKYADKTAKNDL